MKTNILSILLVLIVSFTFTQCENTSPFEPTSGYIGPSDGNSGQVDPPDNNSNQAQPSVQYISANLDMGSQAVTQELLDEISEVTITFQDASVTGDIFGTLNATITYNVPASGSNGVTKHSGNGVLQLKGGKRLSLIFKGTGGGSNLNGTLWGYGPDDQLVMLARYVESANNAIKITGEMYSDTLPAHNRETDPE